MIELSEAEKRQFIARREAIVKFFTNNIGENITRFILGDIRIARPINSHSSYPLYMNNILTLAFIFANCCLRYDIDSSENPVSGDVSGQNALRIINSLRKAYIQYPVTSELVQFVLSDIQFEMLRGAESEVHEIFKRICSFDSEGFSLNKYYKIIAEWRAAPSRFNMNLNDLAGMFLELLDNMKFLSDYDLVRDEDGQLVFTDKKAMIYGGERKYSSLPVHHQLYYDPDRYLGMYSLFSVDKGESDDGTKKLEVRYVTGAGNGSNTVTVNFTVSETESESELTDGVINADADDFYYELTGEDWTAAGEDQGSKKNCNFIENVHTINYKYIKNLALAISDAISVNGGSKRALYKAYRNSYHEGIREVLSVIRSPADAESMKLDWDSIIVMLLIESSPTSVLETLFRAVPHSFKTVAKNLCRRIDNPDMPIHGLTEQQLDREVEKIIRTKLIFGEAGGFGRLTHSNPDERLQDRLYAQAAAILIMSSISTALRVDSVEKAICAGNIYDNISLLKKMKTEFSAEQQCKYVCIILGETFRHILCFYKGLLAYGEEKAVFDIHYGNEFMTESTIASQQKKLHSCFMEAAKKEAEELKGYNPAVYGDMIRLMNRFIRLCENCNSSSDGQKLYAAIGKYEILNVNEFRSHVMGYTSDLSDINEDNADKWISVALDILWYLRRGTFKSGVESPSNAIYPFAATYNRENENYDGYKTVTFALNIDIDGDGTVDREYISVLTEFTYNLSDIFYCLPNVLRSNRKWWIDPVLISFKEFNEIFVE